MEKKMTCHKNPSPDNNDNDNNNNNNNNNNNTLTYGIKRFNDAFTTLFLS
jgi:hypothetical protein